MENEKPNRGPFAAFLLAQVGALAARQFGERLQPLGLTPPQAGILRMLAHTSGMSQRDLADRLGMHASRLVGVVDELESLGLVVRSANSEDRRSYALELTPAGRKKLADVGTVAREHNEALCSALSVEEREILAGLLQRIADAQGLTRGVHPGYSRLGEDSPSAQTSSARDRSGTVVRE